MTISFPRTDIMTAVAFAQAPLRLVPVQELSATAGGTSQGLDLGPALWFGDFVTVAMSNDDAIAFEAMLNSLDGVIFPFEAGDIRRPYPRAHANGVFADTAALSVVNVNNRAIALSGLATGFTLSIGDLLCFDYGGARALHQVSEGAVASALGVTPQFEVRPHIRPGFTIGASVRLKKPAGLFTLLPDSIVSTVRNSLTMSVSFKVGQYL